jgi:hypothetical protein
VFFVVPTRVYSVTSLECIVRHHRLGLDSVIALRRIIERGVRHPVLGPLFFLLLALLLAFTVVHGAHDQIHEGELIVCVAFLLGAIVSIVFPHLRDVVAPARRADRGPPRQLARASLIVLTRSFASAPVPLRL